jgi:hypothetical protein
MKLCLIVGFCALISFGGLTQSENYPNVIIENTEGLLKAEVGTYQFIVYDSKITPAFTNNILYFIEKERKQSTDVVIPLSEHVNLFIPSKDKINSETFEALTDIEFQ